MPICWSLSVISRTSQVEYLPVSGESEFTSLIGHRLALLGYRQLPKYWSILLVVYCRAFLRYIV